MFIYLFFDLLYQRGYRIWYFWRLNEKCLGLRGNYILKQGNQLQNFQNKNKKLFVLFTNFLLTVSYRVSRLINFGDYLKKCRPMRQIFLNEYLFLRSGHRGSKAYSLWDGVVPKPEHRLWLPLDSVPIF